MTASTSSKQGRSLPEKRLTLYGVAASAALAAGASQAQANLITLDLSGVAVTNRTTPPAGSVWFDVNAASAAAAVSTSGPFAGADFRLFNSGGGMSAPPLFASIVGLAPGNSIAGNQSEFFKAQNLTTSQRVGGPEANSFNGSAKIAGGVFPTSFSPGDTGFLGLKFLIGADIHYGWANITVAPGDLVTLNSLGYESDPNTPAHAEPPGTTSSVPDQGSTLALMAMGAAGLIAFRGRQRSAA